VVLEAALSPVFSVSARLASTAEERDALAAWVRKTFKPELEKLGPMTASESPEEQQRRAELFGVLGSLGKDPEVIAQSLKITQQYLTDPESVNPNLAGTATAIAAVNGDAALFDELQKTYETSSNSDEQEGALYRLAYFKDPKLETRALDYAVSGKVRNQDSPHLLTVPFRSADTRELAWQYIQTNWDHVTSQLTKWSASALVGATGNFCDAQSRDQITAFFAAHKVVSSERELKRSVDQINDCIEFRANQEGKLKEWLARQ
jgi:hypothetical protein